MRYTARTRSIEWKQDATTLAAVAALEKLLASDLPHIHRSRLEPGMGLLCNNVLHDRAAFERYDPTARACCIARAITSGSPQADYCQQEPDLLPIKSPPSCDGGLQVCNFQIARRLPAVGNADRVF